MNGEFGLYLHAPFCQRKCGYCHFYVLRNRVDQHRLWQQAILQEWALRAPLVQGCKLRSIYFGGGTPSLLGPQIIGELIAHLGGAEEITLEVNPEGVTSESMADFRAAGVNRISMGVQSFDNAVLKQLDRQHSAEQAIAAVLSAEIENLSIDLMYEVPGLTSESWQRTLETATSLPISHLSLYNLTIEPGTAFHRKRKQLLPLIADADTSAEMLEGAIAHFGCCGFERYEISAFAKPGFRAIHNQGYWEGRPFLGLGPSAFSDWEGRRFRNVANFQRYRSLLAQGLDPCDFSERLNPEARQREQLAIALRRLEGVSNPKLTPTIQSDVERLIALDLLEWSNTTLRLSERGLRFYDSVAVELI